MATGATRTATRVGTPDQAAPVRGMRGGRPVSVELDVRTVYDFVISLAGECGPDDLAAEDRAWLVTARERLAAQVGEAARWTADDLAWGLGVLAVERPEVRSPRDFVELVETTSPVVLARAMFAEELQDPKVRPIVERALAGDAGALDELETRMSDYKPDFRLSLLRRPDVYQRDVASVLRAWLPIFEEVEPRVAAILRRDADARAGDLASMPTLELIERATSGVRWLPEPGVGRVVLAPTYFSRPYNYMLAGDGWRFFGYPVADDAIGSRDPAAPPASLLRYHHALGDESRLRILRLLAERDHYLTELAGRLDLSKPTVKHHLAQLRAAGLITITEQGAFAYWTLRRERIEEAGAELARYLA